jgi:hypothetical protein
MIPNLPRPRTATFRHLPFAVLIVVAFLSPATGGAMVVVERDFPDLVRRAETIVAGTVLGVSNAQKDSGAPITLVTVAELTVMKGKARDSITLEFYGGIVGEYAVRVPDMPTFAPGEQVVLFIAGNGENVCPLVGVWQGSFRIQFDEARGTEIVTTNDGTPIAGIVADQIRPVDRRGDSGGGSAVGLTLDGFRQLIADELTNPSRESR